MGIAGTLALLLVMVDMVVFCLAAIEAFVLYRSGGVTLREIAKRDAALAFEVLCAGGSWFFFKYPALFLSIRLIGRTVQTFGLSWFLRVLTKKD